jgi:release factor glutamine methyltransferase
VGSEAFCTSLPSLFICTFIRTGLLSRWSYTLVGVVSSKEYSVSGLVLWQWRKTAQQQAIAADISEGEIDWLLQEIAGLDRLALRLNSFKHQETVSLRIPFADLEQCWQKRLTDRAPIQYLAGTTPWRRFSLQVSPAVLIPRPETECLIDLAVAATCSPQLRQGHWADLGTGSGAIALGLADAFPQATLHAVDASLEALKVAQQNAQNLGFGDRIQFYHGSWFAPLAALRGNLSGMVSNPPYIPTSLIQELQPEVAWHEPHLALDGGEEGLDAIADLVTMAPDYLKPDGLWLIELMAGQADRVVALLQEQGSYRGIEVHADFAGIDRFVLARRQ